MRFSDMSLDDIRALYPRHFICVDPIGDIWNDAQERYMPTMRVLIWQTEEESANDDAVAAYLLPALRAVK